MKTENTPTVKAYEYGNSIVVKYYDTGEASTLSCPLCHWFGTLDQSTLPSGNDATGSYAEFHCPDCKTKLASVSPTTARKI